ncbi:MAG: cytochrome c-type biogenesis protein CcmH [Pseudomonadales bacterium]|nr:cytochrome c-type biogenesis protein CcmH [Pseudomonadales bacterium]
MSTKLLPLIVCCTLLLLSILLVPASGVYAAIEAYDFAGDREKERRFKSLIEELRCPKCQNQNIADSSAPLAKDLKDRVYKLINEGMSDAEITQYLVDRFGDFVSYRPPMNPSTWFLWFGPLCVLLIAFSVIVFRVTSKAKKTANRPQSVDTQRVAQLLKTYVKEAEQIETQGDSKINSNDIDKDKHKVSVESVNEEGK